MRPLTQAMNLMLLGGMVGVFTGCRDDSPPPPRVPVPTYDERRQAVSRSELDVKPLPPPRYAPQDAYPPFDDVPLVSQQAPETPVFLDAYRRVGSPRIVVFVNRALDAQQVGGGQDELRARGLDYEAMENILTDWLSCNGQVTIISPIMARQRTGSTDLTFEQVQQLGADVFVRAEVRPSEQTADGRGFRLVAEAMNVKGGQSIARAVVDVPPPLEKTKINTYTRFTARKLMDGMIGSWLTPPADAQRRPATQPQ